MTDADGILTVEESRKFWKRNTKANTTDELYVYGIMSNLTASKGGVVNYNGTINTLVLNADELNIGNPNNNVARYRDNITTEVGLLGGPQTIQEAIDEYNGTSAVQCIIQVPSGSYAESLSVTNLGTFNTKTAGLTIEGDTRPIAGITLAVNCEDIESIPFLGGDSLIRGTITFGVVGLVIMVANSGPGTIDFTQAELDAGVDRVIIVDSLGVISTATITSFTATSIMVNAAPLTVSSVTFLPNRAITGGVFADYVVSVNQLCKFKGFYIAPSFAAVNYGSVSVSGAKLTLENCVLDPRLASSPLTSLNCQDSSVVLNAMSVFGGANAMLVTDNSSLFSYQLNIVISQKGLTLKSNSSAELSDTTITTCVTGINVEGQSSLYIVPQETIAFSLCIQSCITGIYITSSSLVDLGGMKFVDSITGIWASTNSSAYPSLPTLPIYQGVNVNNCVTGLYSEEKSIINFLTYQVFTSNSTDTCVATGGVVVTDVTNYQPMTTSLNLVSSIPTYILGKSTPLALDPLSFTLASATVVVTFPGHGFVNGQIINMSGVPAGLVQGVPDVELNTSHLVSNTTLTTFEITVTTPATGTGTGGGALVVVNSGDITLTVPASQCYESNRYYFTAGTTPTVNHIIDFTPSGLTFLGGLTTIQLPTQGSAAEVLVTAGNILVLSLYGSGII